jgi:hypothetical protein
MGMKMKINILTFFLACSITLLAQEITFYNLDIKIDVNQKNVQVSGTMEVDFQNKDTLNLILWKYSDIREISADNSKLKYNFDTVSPSPIIYIKKGGNLKIIKPSGTPDKNNIKIIYSCNMQNLNDWAQNFSDEWIEINFYTAWFPVSLNGGNFTSSMVIHIDTSYAVTGSGIISKGNDGWKMEQSWKSFDNVIIASKNLKTKYLKEPGLYVEVVYDDFPGSAADSTITECKYVLNLLGNYFGKKDESYLKYIIAPFEKGGGYSRKNFISMRTKNYNYYTQSKGIAHEIAHFWWRNANTSTWEDWLNESFAEYSMLMYTRDRFGVDKFNKQIEDYRSNTKNLPPVWGIDRNSNQAYTVLYEKGSVILFELENKIGKDKFLNLLKKMSKNNIFTTNNFLTLLEKETSAEIRQWMEKQLKS